MTKPAKASSRNGAVSLQTLVSVVDDDESVRESLPDLLKELGFSARAFASAEDFLKSDYRVRNAMPDIGCRDARHDRTAIAARLNARGEKIKIIFITARADEGVRKHLIAQGAVECLFKPFSEQGLRAALDAALRKS